MKIAFSLVIWLGSEVTWADYITRRSFHFARDPAGLRPARCAQACGIEEQHLVSRMIEETIHHRGTTLVRRLILAPGEATRWHRDPFHRVSVVLKGEALLIEFHDGGASANVAVTPGQVDWDEPGDRTHRAVNVGGAPYEEVTTFFLAHPDDVPQPDAD